MATEKRRIDANVFAEHLERMARTTYPNLLPGLLEAAEYARTFLPTVDAVEVVRCKDCRWSRTKDHREPTDTSRRLICQCFKHHHIPAPWGARLAVEPDDFCSYGERRTDGKHT